MKRTKQITIAFIVGFILTLAIAVIFLGDRIVPYVEGRMQDKAEVYEAEEDTRDNIQKLTDNIGDKARSMEDSKVLLQRAKQTVIEAEAFYDTDVAEYSDAVASLFLYQGIQGIEVIQ